MRIKLRLYARDLDLIALKYTPNFRLGNAIRTALLDYVKTGKVNQIYVEAPAVLPELPQCDQIDICITGEAQEDVVSWIMSLKPVFRSVAVKSVIRAAMGNPILAMYAVDSSIPLRPLDNCDTYVTHNVGAPSEPANKQPPQKLVERNKSDPIIEELKASNDASPVCSDEELDLFEFDAFDNI